VFVEGVPTLGGHMDVMGSGFRSTVLVNLAVIAVYKVSVEQTVIKELSKKVGILIIARNVLTMLTANGLIRTKDYNVVALQARRSCYVLQDLVPMTLQLVIQLIVVLLHSVMG
jgi:hypothetical protein